MKTAALAAFVLFALCAEAAAQPTTTPATPPAAQQQRPRGPDLVAQHAAMDRLASMAGDWQGQANVISPVQRTVFQTEHVEPDMDGLLLVIHGHGYATADRSGAPIFNAVGVISYNDRAGSYEFRVYNDGNAATATARFLDDGRLQWTMDFTPVIIRYTITFGDGRWNEIGEMSRDGGATWSRTIEMNLQKVR